MVFEPRFSGAHRRLTWLGLAAAALVASAPASAESIFDALFNSNSVSTNAVRANLERSGYQVRSAIEKRGSTYVVDAAYGQGYVAHLVLDAHTGGLVQGVGMREQDWAARQKFDPGANWKVARPRDHALYANLGAESEPGAPAAKVVARSEPASQAFPPSAPPANVASPSSETPVRAERPRRPKARWVKPATYCCNTPVAAAAPTATDPAPHPDAPAPAVIPNASPNKIVVPASTVAPKPVAASPAPIASTDAAPPKPTTASLTPTPAAAKPAPAPKTKPVNDIPVAPLD